MRGGQDPAQFETWSLREAFLILEASALRDADQARLSAVFIAYAFHDHKNIPDVEEPSAKGGKSDVAYVRAWMRAVSGEVNGN